MYHTNETRKGEEEEEEEEENKKIKKTSENKDWVIKQYIKYHIIKNRILAQLVVY